MSTGDLRRATLFFLNHYCMVTIKKRRLVIELVHPLPEELLDDLRAAMINGVRVLVADAARDIPTLSAVETSEVVLPMLQLLNAMTYAEGE